MTRTGHWARRIRNGLLFLLLALLASSPVAGQDAEFSLWLQRSRDRLSAEGWPVDRLPVPTTDAECQRLFNEYRVAEKRYWDDFCRERSAIETDAKLSEPDRRKSLRLLREGAVARAREMGLDYQLPVALYAKERANFEHHRAGGSEDDFIRLTKGTPPSSDRHGGILSDVDAEGADRVVDDHTDRIRRITENARMTLGPTYVTEEIVDMTVFRRTDPSKLGWEDRLAAYRAGADSKEIDLSAWMDADQPCRDLAELETHIKKGAKGITADPQKLLRDPMTLEATAKVAGKALKTAPLENAALRSCLEKAGFAVTPEAYRQLLHELKYEHKGMTPGETGVLKPETAEAFQRSVTEVFVACQAEAEATARRQLSLLKQEILVAEGAGDTAKAKRLRAKYLDSIAISVEAANANHRRLSGVKGLGELFPGLRYRLEPLHANERFRTEARDFLLQMKGGRFSRRAALLVMNFLARKSPHAVRDAVGAALSLDTDGTLAADPEFQALLKVLESTRGLPPDGTDLSKHAGFLAAARKCKDGVVRLNEFLDADLSRLRSVAAVKGMDLWFGVEEALTYWEAFQQEGMAGVATELVRYRVPLLDNIVREDYLRAAWEVVCYMYPPAAQLTLAFAFGTRIGMLGVNLFWDYQLESLVDEIYAGSEFRLAREGDAAGARWEFTRADFRGRELTREDFLAEEDTYAFGDFDAEVDLRMTIAAADPVLVMYDRMAKDLGPAAMGRFVVTYEQRWDAVKRWWAARTILALEERMAAEDALVNGELLDAMNELDRVLRDLDVEEWVRNRMAIREFSASEKTYLFWVNVRTWLTDGEEHLFSKADAATRAIVVRLASKELRWLRAYREVLETRDTVEAALGMPGRRDRELRLLTGFFFLTGAPAEDVRTARRWRAWLPRRAQEVSRELLAMKRRFRTDAALDTEFDRATLEALLVHEAWARGWREAELSLQRLIVPVNAGAASHFWAPFDRGAAWLGEFYAYVDATRTEAIAVAEMFLETRRAERARKDHEDSIRDLLAEFRAHYAGEARGRARILVRLLDGDVRTNRPVSGAVVTDVATDRLATETEPGVYEFAGLAPGPHRFLASADGFSSREGDPAAAAMLTVPAEPEGPPPGAVVHLRPDELSLRGEVRDDLGKPVLHAKLRLVRDDGGPGFEVRPGGDGRFVFRPVAPGKVRVEIDAPGYRPLPAISRVVEAPTRAGQGPEDVRFYLMPIRSEVVVRARDGAGAPVPDATVSLGDEVATTGADGRAAFPAVRPDTAWPLAVRKDGYVPFRDAVPLLPVAEPSSVEVEAVLAGGVGLEVRVRDLETGRPVAGARIVVSDVEPRAAAETDDRGTVRFTALAPEFAYLDVTGAGFAPRRNVEVDLRDVAAGASRVVEICVEFGMRLDVLIQDEKGELVPGAYVSLDGGPDLLAPTGRAVIEPLKAGDHRIRVKARGYSGADLDYVADPLATPRDTRRVRLTPAPTLTVEVRDPTGALLRSVPSRIRLVRDGAEGPSAVGPVHTFADLPPGEYSARATASWWGRGASGTVRIGAEPESHVLVVTLGIVASLQVDARAASGALPEGVTISLSGGGHHLEGAGSSVRFGGLLPGRYVLRATASGFAPARRSVDFAPAASGAVVTVRLTLEPLEEKPPESAPPAGLLFVRLNLRGAAVLSENGKERRIEPRGDGAGDLDQVKTRGGGLLGTVELAGEPYRLGGRRFTASRQWTDKSGSVEYGSIEKLDARWTAAGVLSEDGSRIEHLTLTYERSWVMDQLINEKTEDNEWVPVPSLKREKTWSLRGEFRDLPLVPGDAPGTLVCELRGMELESRLVRVTQLEHEKVTPVHPGLTHYKSDVRSTWLGPVFREGLENSLRLEFRPPR